MTEYTDVKAAIQASLRALYLADTKKLKVALYYHRRMLQEICKELFRRLEHE